MDQLLSAFIVEDEPIIKLTVAKLLEKERFRVGAYASAEAFLDESNRAPPHLLVTDKNLPGISGLQLVERLRSEGRTFEAIVITGYADLDSAIEAVRLGLYSYIRKPFGLDVLITDIRGAAARLRERLAPREEAPATAEADSQMGELLKEVKYALQYTGTHLEALQDALEDMSIPPLIMENIELAARSARNIEQTVRDRIHRGSTPPGAAPSFAVDTVPISNDLTPILKTICEEFAERSKKELKPLVVESDDNTAVEVSPDLAAQIIRGLLDQALDSCRPRGMVIADLKRQNAEAILTVVVQEVTAGLKSGELVEGEELRGLRESAQQMKGRLEVTPYLGGLGVEYLLAFPLSPSALTPATPSSDS
jgi:FixJ family two-component response regulator